MPDPDSPVPDQPGIDCAIDAAARALAEDNGVDYRGLSGVGQARWRERAEVTVRAWQEDQRQVAEEAVPGDKFRDWPENLPREDLIRLLRGYAGECRHVEQNIAAAFPDEYPLGDGVYVPRDQRVVIDEGADEMSLRAASAITDLRAERDEALAEVAKLRDWVAFLDRGLRCVAGDDDQRPSEVKLTQVLDAIIAAWPRKPIVDDLGCADCPVPAEMECPGAPSGATPEPDQARPMCQCGHHEFAHYQPTEDGETGCCGAGCPCFRYVPAPAEPGQLVWCPKCDAYPFRRKPSSKGVSCGTCETPLVSIPAAPSEATPEPPRPAHWECTCEGPPHGTGPEADCDVHGQPSVAYMQGYRDGDRHARQMQQFDTAVAPAEATPEREGDTAPRLIGPMTRRIGQLAITLRRLVELHDGGPIVDNQPLPPEQVQMMRLLAYERAREVLADNTIHAEQPSAHTFTSRHIGHGAVRTVCACGAGHTCRDETGAGLWEDAHRWRVGAVR